MSDPHRHHHAHHHRDHHDRPQDAHAHHDRSPAARWRRFAHLLAHRLTPHSHESADKLDPALEASARGLRALWVSLAVLGATALAQAAVVVASGSVALLGDTVHNTADALTAVPLAIAFVLGRRAATRRFTYGYGRAEDLAGIVIVLTIAASAVFAAWTAVDRLLDPRPVAHVPASTTGSSSSGRRSGASSKASPVDGSTTAKYPPRSVVCGGRPVAGAMVSSARQRPRVPGRAGPSPPGRPPPGAAGSGPLCGPLPRRPLRAPRRCPSGYGPVRRGRRT